MGVNYPLFFVGSILVAIAIFYIRKVDKNRTNASFDLDGSSYNYGKPEPESRTVEGIGLFLKPEPLSDLAGIKNLTQQVAAINAGTYKPNG